MKKTIWKFVLQAKDDNIIQMPKNAEILTVQMQGGVACMWALVHPEAKKEPRHFEIFGTGHPISYGIDVNRIYIGTCQLVGGDLIFHVFEILN